MKHGKRVSTITLLAVAALAFGALAADCLALVDATWIATDPDLWTGDGNWDTGVYPNDIGDTARFTGSGHLVGLDAPITLGRLVLSQDATGYRIDGSLGGSLMLDNGGAGSTIEVEGTHYIEAPMALVDALTIRNTWLAGSGSADLYLQDSVSGNADLTVRGDLDGVKWLPTAPKPGTHVYLSAENTLQGAVRVRSSGSLTLLGLGTALNASSFRVDHAASLNLDNYDLNLLDRVASPVGLYGGTLRFYGTAGDMSFEEVPLVSFMRGASTVECAHGPGGQAILVLQNWGAALGATANFTGYDLGNLDQIHIQAEVGGPTLDDGILGGWTRVGFDFASYDLVSGVVPLTSYFTDDINDAGPADNVLVTDWADLLSDRSVNSLKITGGTWMSMNGYMNLNGYTLNIESGGLIAAPPEDSSGNYGGIFYGFLTAGGAVPNTELTVHLGISNLFLYATIADNPGGSVGLTVSGDGSPTRRSNPTLFLEYGNLYSGGTTVNACTLDVRDDSCLGAPGTPVTLVGGTLLASWSFITDRPITIEGMAAIETPDTMLTLQGPIHGDVETLYVRGGGTLVLAAPNDFAGSVNVGPHQTLALAEAGGLSPVGDMTLRCGAGLILDNSGIPAVGRVPRPVTSRGGELVLVGSNIIPVAEVLPAFTALAGASVIQCASLGLPTILQIDCLQHSCGATVDFRMADPLSQIMLSFPPGPPPVVNGILGAWAVSGNDWATLDPAGVRPLTDPEYFTGDINGAVLTDNVKILGPAILAAPMGVNSVKMACPVPLDLNGNILSLESGGLLFGSEGGGGGGGGITNGFLTVGCFGSMANELIVHLRSDAFIHATIAEAAAGLALTVSGDPTAETSYTLILASGNAYSGPTTVNAATLAIVDDSALGYALAPLSLVGGTLRADGSFEANRPMRVDGEATIEVASGCFTTWNGTLFGDVETLLVAGSGTLALTADNTFQGNIIVGMKEEKMPMAAIAPRSPDRGTLTTYEPTSPTLSIDRDANLGDPENGVTLNGGILEITSSFQAGPQRVFTVGNMDGVFVVGPVMSPPMEVVGATGSRPAVGSGDPVTFVLGEPNQLVAQGGMMLKSGSGTMVLAASNEETGWGGWAVVLEGILELQHPRAFPSAIILLDGHLNLRNDDYALFESNVDLWSNATIDVGPLTQPEPRDLSLANLRITDGMELTATGSSGYSLGVASPCNIGAAAAINTASADVTLWSGISAWESETSTLTKSGPGALNVNSTVSCWGSVTLHAVQGTLNLNADVHDPWLELPRYVTVAVEGEGTVANLNTSQNLAALNLASGGRAVLTTGRNDVLVTNGLTILEDESGLATATLDITTGAAVIDYGAAGSPNPTADVRRSRGRVRPGAASRRSWRPRCR